MKLKVICASLVIISVLTKTQALEQVTNIQTNAPDHLPDGQKHDNEHEDHGHDHSDHDHQPNEHDHDHSGHDHQPNEHEHDHIGHDHSGHDHKPNEHDHDHIGHDHEEKGSGLKDGKIWAAAIGSISAIGEN